MKTFCDYHPTKPAQWECPNCNANYCTNCITKRVTQSYGKKQEHYFCPKCNVPANKLAIGNVIVPFWIRLPKIFLYPFYPRSIVLMIVLALASSIFTGRGLMIMLIHVAIWGILLKYSFAALKDTSVGKLVPPKINQETISDNFQVVFKQLGIFLIIYLAFFKIAQTAGIIIGLLFLCFAFLSIPAMITVLVVTDSLISALNPMLFIRMAWRIGWGYLLMYLFLLFLLFAPTAIGKYIIIFFPESLHVFLYSIAKNYYSIISYHLMGYVMLQYHEEIGWSVEFDDDLSSEGAEPEGDEGNEILNRVDMLIKDGQIDDAISFIKGETGGDISDLDLAERYYKLLKVKQLIPELLEHCKKYMDLLAKAKEGDRLRQVYLECLSKDKEFMPSPSTLFTIGGLLNEGGDHKGAINAYNRFIKSNPDSPLIPKAYFLGANILNEKLKAPQKAAKILNNLIKKYPDHDIVPHVRHYLKKVVS